MGKCDTRDDWYRFLGIAKPIVTVRNYKSDSIPRASEHIGSGTQDRGNLVTVSELEH
jgi:hypothetical protein